ncbi:bifunctional diaminohydroxyphosphoribosylaminopyrimidine deaminase/5-amino-6-(5-phosphoribosylamino)uracil reductase RibD [Rhodocaloribacter litoris]|nr:bifunctional diaminohydroxyphosphoribosylaminopyrimidine deaminase/5-amino-6-(5-phosphoribosylamino)uracil reductase RibD [Rhodocaloribacter litoris]
MRRCLELAARGAGHVSPNPMVGAVLVGPDGRRLGEGWHRVYGGPHAEVFAIEEAERRHGAAALHTATLYVNLEPCSHHGKTPPCADLIVAKGIPRVVVGMEDPFPAVSGRGLARLRAHGVAVTTGVLEAACRRLNEAFVHHVRTGRPLVTLKVAQTLDGRVATATGDARWISGEAARRLVHRWRSELDAVLVGSGTARADDPALTVRHVAGRQPARLVLDRTGTLPPTLRLFTDEHAARTVAVVGPEAAPPYARALLRAGGALLHLPTAGGHLDLPALLDRLGRDGGRDGGRPLQSLLVEAGPGLASALFAQDLVDRYFVFIAPRVLGGGLPALSLPGPERMAEARTFAEHRWTRTGDDLLFQGYRHPVS